MYMSRTRIMRTYIHTRFKAIRPLCHFNRFVGRTLMIRKPYICMAASLHWGQLVAQRTLYIIVGPLSKWEKIIWPLLWWNRCQGDFLRSRIFYFDDQLTFTSIFLTFVSFILRKKKRCKKVTSDIRNILYVHFCCNLKLVPTYSSRNYLLFLYRVSWWKQHEDC